MSTLVTISRRATLETVLVNVTPREVRRVNLRAARALVADIRESFAFAHAPARLLTAPDGNTKIARNVRPTWSLFLSPARSGGINTCERSTPQCRAACLYTAGRATFDPRINLARQWRTRFAAEHPAEFLALLTSELDRIRTGSAIRLNGTSDVRWELVPVVRPYLTRRGVRAYDYTKWTPSERASAPAAYALTYSASERWTDDDIGAAVLGGHRVAVVLSGMPRKGTDPIATYRGLPAVDGDVSDYRPADGPAVIALRPKGRAKATAGRFVREYVR